MTSRAAAVARDLANGPPAHLTASALADVAAELGARYGFEVESFDKAQLIELGCGGILGVNAGSAEEPRMVKLRYLPDGEPTGHLGLVGKGIMYDSGGISISSDPMHLLMKMDMGGAAAVLGAFTALRDLGTTNAVTGWLMCTDNMPSGSAYKLGDVLTARGGRTVEIKNTDAEGRLAMMDALVLAVEEGVDAIIDIATLTGAVLVALGPSTAGLFGNHRELLGRVKERRRRPPTSRCGSCRWRRSTASSSTPRSPTSRTSAGPSPVDDGRAVPPRVRRRHPVGARRHRRHHAGRRRRGLAVQGCDRVRGPAARRGRAGLPGRRLSARYSATTSRVCTVGSAAYAMRLPAARAARRASTASRVTSSPGASTGMPGG